MKLQTQPNRASCLLVSLAMCIDTPYSQLFDILGHDGTEVLWPGYPVPKCYRGFHESEIAWLAITFGCSFTKLEKVAYLGHMGRDVKSIELPYDFASIKHKGIFMDSGHAVAYDGEKVYDPNGTIYDYVDKYEVFYHVTTI